MPQITVIVGDSLWATVSGKYKEITAGGDPSKVPDNQIDLTYAVIAVGSQGDTLVEKMTKTMFVVPVGEGKPFYASAMAFAADNDKPAGVTRAVIKIQGFLLVNLPVSEEKAG